MACPAMVIYFPSANRYALCILLNKAFLALFHVYEIIDERFGEVVGTGGVTAFILALTAITDRHRDSLFLYRILQILSGSIYGQGFTRPAAESR